MNFSEAMFYENYLTSDFHTNTLRPWVVKDVKSASCFFVSTQVVLCKCFLNSLKGGEKKMDCENRVYYLATYQIPMSSVNQKIPDV